MSAREDAGEETATVDGGPSARLLRAAELLVSAHASRARDEASRDLSRIGSGAVLLVAAIALAAPALLLLDLALVLVVEQKMRWGFPASCAFVAVVDLVLAVGAAFAARSRLMAPVLVETRSTLKRAAVVLRGA
jgi:hypothetical protein